MAKGYWVSAYRTISYPEKLAAYDKLAGPAVQAGGGRALAHESAAYQEALAALSHGVERDFRIIEGIDRPRAQPVGTSWSAFRAQRHDRRVSSIHLPLGCVRQVSAVVRGRTTCATAMLSVPEGVDDDAGVIERPGDGAPFDQ